MPYLFYGNNTFILNKKVKELIEKFSKNQFGDFNISHLEGGSFTFEDYSKFISTPPFLGTKRLIIIKNFLLNNKDEGLRKNVADSLKKIPETSVVFFVEHGVPDMRTALFKALNKPKFSQNLSAITPDKLNYWIEDKVKEEGIKISPEAKTKLQVFVGSDLWRLENEIKKLALFAKSQKRNAISPEAIEEMVKAENNSTIFQFIDLIAQGNSKKALLALKNLTATGEDEFYIFSMIVYQFRNLFLVSELDSRGLTKQNIAKEAKIHPFVVAKSKSLLRYYKRDKLKKIYLALFNVDRQIKSGLIDSGLALDLLTINIAEGKV